MAASMAASMLCFFVFITGGASQETCTAGASCESTISQITLLQRGVTLQSEKLDPLRAGEDMDSVAGQNGGGLNSSGDRFESVVTETKDVVLHSWKSSYKATKDVLHPWIKPLSASAVITTVALQLSPMPSSLQIRVARDVMRFDGYPYFTVLAGATQWCLYGSAATYYSGDHSFLTMVAANGLGMLFGVFYIINFFKFVPGEDIRCRALRCYLLVGLMLLILQVVVVASSMHERAMFWLGLLGSIGSTQIALSPFKTLPEVLKTRSTRSWPLDLCVWNFVQSFFTGSFGLSNNDPWVWIPNVVGVIAAMVQLGLIAKFWEPSATRPSLYARKGENVKDGSRGVVA